MQQTMRRLGLYFEEANKQCERIYLYDNIDVFFDTCVVVARHLLAILVAWNRIESDRENYGMHNFYYVFLERDIVNIV